MIPPQGNERSESGGRG